MSPTSERPAGRTVLIAAFTGWNDAGEAASSAVAHLNEHWHANLIGALDSEDYYDFQVNRPQIGFDAESGERRITWPQTQLYRAAVPELGDVILVTGIEPSIRWRSFVAELLDIIRLQGVDLVLTLGALLADAPHTRPVPVSGTSSDSLLATDLGLEQSTYEGPTGIIGILQEACREAELPAASLWAAVPHYVSTSSCPKATLALLTRLEDLFELTFDLDDLRDESRAWQSGVDDLTALDPEVSDYVSQLEHALDTADLPEASGEAIAKEFERFLRRRDV